MGIPNGLGNRSRRDGASCRLEVDRLNSVRRGSAKFPSRASSNSIKSPILRLGCPLVGGLCSSFKLAFAFVVIFLTQPSSVPPMLSSPVDAFDGVVDIGSNGGGGDWGAKFGRC